MNFSFFKTKWIAILLILLVIAGMIVYPKLKDYRNATSTDTTAPGVGASTQRKPLNVTFEVIGHKSLTERINVVGSLLPDEEVNLTFESSGKLIGIYFREGSMVKQGDLLAKINDLPLQAQLKRLTAQLPLAENRVFRQKTLLEKDAVSQEALEQVNSELEQLRAEIELIKAQIAQTELKAPFDGYIGLRNVSEGSYVSTATIIARLARVSPMKIDFSVPERYAFQIQKGTPIEFRTDVKPVLTEATVYALDATINQETRTRNVRAVFPNTKGEWVPGAFVSVEISLSEISNAIAIPSQALVPELGKDRVFLYKSGKAEPVEVIAGLRTDARVQIIKGLQVGDTLLTSGTLQLRTGMPVVLIQ
ncbi:MAG: efflux RND transporter periplasmic adaptor subunit [Prevotellaceae bacterium]|jgi:membrane fusion protein (multidrug efflux system)|nr:efflux RND transporter periplasmic adaptor subunit [Prevotellaceae bacterium]